MARGDDFELTIVESMEAHAPREIREGIASTDLTTTPEEALEALKATKGAAAVLKQLPLLDRPELWFTTAYFSVCRKTGTARYLDFWDTDEFDGFTDHRRCVSDCRAWFRETGTRRGAPERRSPVVSTATSRRRRPATTRATRSYRAGRRTRWRSSSASSTTTRSASCRSSGSSTSRTRRTSRQEATISGSDRCQARSSSSA